MKGTIRLFILTIITTGLFLISPSISLGKKSSKHLPLVTSAKKWKVTGSFTIYKKPHTISSRQDFWIKSGENFARHLNVTADGYTIPESSYPGRYLSSTDGYKAIPREKIVVEIISPTPGRIQSPDQPKYKPKVTAVATIADMARFTQPAHGSSYISSRLEGDINIIWTRGKAPYTLSIMEARRGGKSLYYKEGIMSTAHSVPAGIFTKKGRYEISLTYKMTGFSFSGDYLPGSKLTLRYLTYIRFEIK